MRQLYVCIDCGQPTNRSSWQAMCCFECSVKRRKASTRRYAVTPAAKALDCLRHQTPREKLRAAAWAEKHIERVRGYSRKYRLKMRVPIIVKCQAICNNTFIRNGKRGAKRYCDPCVEAFYGKRYRLNRKAA